MIYTLKIYRLDKRCKAGERLVGTYEYDRRGAAEMYREVKELYMHHYPRNQFRIEYAEKFITVKNMMSGKDVVIAADTPWSCRPDSEAYWSN